MGVLNVTPDSFSDGSLYLDPAAALAHGRQLVAEGAHILDIGGESTGPGRQPLGAAGELERIEPVVRALAREAPLSIDTYHSSTADRCLALGARIVNDVSALRADPDMVRVVRGHDAVLVLMHAKDGPMPHVTDRPSRFSDLVAEVGDFLLRRAEVALGSGLAETRIVLDPGMGSFLSLEPEDSWRLLDGFARLVERLRPFPVMIACSRKGFLGVPQAERDPLSQLAALVAVTRGAVLVRTHDVRMMRQFVEAGRRMGLALPGGPGERQDAG